MVKNTERQFPACDEVKNPKAPFRGEVVLCRQQHHTVRGEQTYDFPHQERKKCSQRPLLTSSGGERICPCSALSPSSVRIRTCGRCSRFSSLLLIDPDPFVVFCVASCGQNISKLSTADVRRREVRQGWGLPECGPPFVGACGHDASGRCKLTANSHHLLPVKCDQWTYRYIRLSIALCTQSSSSCAPFAAAAAATVDECVSQRVRS